MDGPSPHATDPGANRAPPDLLSAWPRSSQYALAVLIALTLGLIAIHIVAGRLSDARPTILEPEKTLTKAIDLNKADHAMLRQVPEVGDKLATAIIEYRQNRGGFGSVDELQNVSGVGKAKLARIRPWVYVDGDDQTGDEDTTTPVSMPEKKTSSTPPRSRKSDGLKGLVDLNTADEDQLKKVDGIGPVRARSIIEARQKQPFRKVEDLMKVPGIKQKTFDRIKPHVTVQPVLVRDDR